MGDEEPDLSRAPLLAEFREQGQRSERAVLQQVDRAGALLIALTSARCAALPWSVISTRMVRRVRSAPTMIVRLAVRSRAPIAEATTEATGGRTRQQSSRRRTFRLSSLEGSGAPVMTARPWSDRAG
ncbi:hypothetical protein IQ63_40835 [Streptomyces acidiscabies]|uniref:Uncharacterized protein n=1 Tax=Streptomyces acidiscabies TaxID=42234 RepID=A0A0L0JIS8_9ACTN|nr:hypothetical protein IQ63_40835 [Streptomyces acidiscabies]